eukprot:scaffold1018_cov241-Pinguiococcus_pyrenoidosus.AAC.2
MSDGGGYSLNDLYGGADRSDFMKVMEGGFNLEEYDRRQRWWSRAYLVTTILDTALELVFIWISFETLRKWEVGLLLALCVVDILSSVYGLTKVPRDLSSMNDLDYFDELDLGWIGTRWEAVGEQHDGAKGLEGRLRDINLLKGVKGIMLELPFLVFGVLVSTRTGFNPIGVASIVANALLIVYNVYSISTLSQKVEHVSKFVAFCVGAKKNPYWVAHSAGFRVWPDGKLYHFTEEFKFPPVP